MDNIDNVNNIISAFPPRIRTLVRELWTSTIGLGAGNINLKPFANTYFREEHSVLKNNHVIVSVPYCGHDIKFEFVFNEDDYSFAPDFYLSDESFFADPDVDSITANLPSLANWNVNDPKALVNVIQELIKALKTYQIDLLNQEKYSRLHFEYNSLIQSKEADADNVEVYIDESGMVHFLILLRMDYSSLPPYLQYPDNDIDDSIYNPGTDAALLKVKFLRADGGRIHAQLFLSPHIEQVFYNFDNIHVPPFPSDQCLMDYVPEIKKLVADKVAAISANFKKKNEFMSALVTMFGTNVLEYDSMTFSQATLLFEHNNFYWIMNITLGKRFPKDKPKVSLRSIYALHNGKPYVENVDSYPYSPRWSPQEMMQRIIQFVVDNIATFQSNSVPV